MKIFTSLFLIFLLSVHLHAIEISGRIQPKTLYAASSLHTFNVTLYLGKTVVRQTRVSPFGFYSFVGLIPGVYIVKPSARQPRIVFEPSEQIVILLGDEPGVNFSALSVNDCFWSPC